MMYELYPYFTNDGTVGLFSPHDDDIYHSTYGALSESWQKFVLPARLKEYLATHSSVKILDICYGIGYNTKTALNVFVSQKNITKSNKYNKFLNKNDKNRDENILAPTSSIAAICSDNILSALNAQEEGNKVSYEPSYASVPTTREAATEPLTQINVPVDAADELKKRKIFFAKVHKIISDLNLKMKTNLKSQSENNLNSKINIPTFEKNRNTPTFSIEAIGSDNILTDEGVHVGTKNSKLIANDDSFCSEIIIDAIDTDNALINISPFITNKIKRKNISDNKIKISATFSSAKEGKFFQIQKIKNDDKNSVKLVHKSLRILPEVGMIILQSLMNQNEEFLKDKVLQKLLSEKKYAQYFDPNMLNFAKFYSNQGYKHNKKSKISAFLHNIYYRYISSSYKKVQKLQKLSSISLNFHSSDARDYICSCERKYSFIFLDAFTPAKCPCLWSKEFFLKLYEHMEDDGMLLTYSSSAAVRAAMLAAGFHVGKTFDSQLKKFVGTMAVKNPSLIEHKLSQKDLDLIDSKAGICYRDENLNLDNYNIIKNREREVEQSDLASSSSVLKGYKND